MTLSFVLSTIHFFYTTLSLPIIELVPYTTYTVLSLFIATSTLSLYYLYTHCFVSVLTEQYAILFDAMFCYAMFYYINDIFTMLY